MMPAFVSPRPSAIVEGATGRFAVHAVEAPTDDSAPRFAFDQGCVDCGKTLSIWSSQRCDPCSRKARTKAIPEDFLAYMQDHTQEQAAHDHEVSVGLIQKWCRAVGYKKPPVRKAVPAWLKADGPSMTRAQIKHRAHVGDAVLDRWIAETGVTCLPAQIKHLKRGTWKPAKHTAPIRSKAEDAAEYLRRFGPVYRCDERGAAKQGGAMWRRGSAVLTDADLIERAYANRWNPDAWKQIGVAA